ncbi:hypothetical protein AMECASPLE_010332 [Ameca splendens]|uniref:Uncharacterized protein n=1 Tax=Ameca splendens TaxID=208324 RepID=A0ABV0YZK0_9TELE
MLHFVNGKPTREYPNPVVAVQVLNHTREQLGACRKPPKHRLGLAELNASSSCTDYAEETQQHVDDCESPEQPPLFECQLEREPEEGQSTVKEKNLEEENNNMKLTLRETDIESLKAQIDTLVKKIIIIIIFIGHCTCI